MRVTAIVLKALLLDLRIAQATFKIQILSLAPIKQRGYAGRVGCKRAFENRWSVLLSGLSRDFLEREQAGETK